MTEAERNTEVVSYFKWNRQLNAEIEKRGWRSTYSPTRRFMRVKTPMQH